MKANARVFAIPQKASSHIARLVRKRENAVSALRFEPKPPFFQQPHRPFGRIAMDATRQKFSAVDNVLQKFGGGKVIGEIAAPLPRDIDLFACLFVFFDDEHFVAARRGGICRHQPGRARADHDHFFHLYFHRSIDREIEKARCAFSMSIPPYFRRDILYPRLRQDFYLRPSSAPCAI